jgi:hypothetical protein
VKKTPAEQLFALDVALDRAIDQLGDEFEGKARRMARDWFRTVVAFVGTLPGKNGFLSPSGAAKAAGITRALEDAGDDLQRQLERAFDSFADVSKQALKGLAVGGHDTSLRPIDLQVLTAYRNLKIIDFRELQAGILGRVSSAVRKAAVSGQNVNELFIEVDEVLSEWPWRARTLFESSIAEFSQVVTATKAGQKDRVFLYTGPIDSRIRNFCIDRVGRVFSRAAIDKMDNGQMPNTFLTRGGYNCRHQWRDVTDIPELAKLADTGMYATPELQGRVASTRLLLKGPAGKGRRRTA